MKAPIVAAGTRPPGARTEDEAALWVKKMFEDVAPRYDLLNHLLSFNIDRLWRKQMLRAVAPILQRPGALALDLCCGTGDSLYELQRHGRGLVLGADFCHPMLVKANEKLSQRRLTPRLVEADALRLPVRPYSLDLITVSFGFRNFANYADGLRELLRVLRPGGTLAILEFSHPRSLLIRWAYSLYSKFVLPLIGRFVSRSAGAYTYLPNSIKAFPTAPALRALVLEAGFKNCKYRLLTGGIVALHVAKKANLLVNEKSPIASLMAPIEQGHLRK